MVTLLGARAAATTKSLAAHGLDFGTPLSRNAPRHWERRRRSKASLDGQRSKTPACDCGKRSALLLPIRLAKIANVRVTRYSPSTRALQPFQHLDTSMSFVKDTQPQRTRKASKRVLLGETREEEAARLKREIAAHPVTRCKPGEHNPSSSRPGWSSKPIISLSEQRVAEGIARKIMRKP